MKSYNKQLIALFADESIKQPACKCKSGSILGTILQQETSFLIGNHKTRERLWYVKNNVHEQV